MKEGGFEETQCKQHEDRATSYFVICGFIFVIKPRNCLFIMSAFVGRTTSGQMTHFTVAFAVVPQR